MFFINRVVKYWYWRFGWEKIWVTVDTIVTALHYGSWLPGSHKCLGFIGTKTRTPTHPPSIWSAGAPRGPLGKFFQKCRSSTAAPQVNISLGLSPSITTPTSGLWGHASAKSFILPSWQHASPDWWRRFVASSHAILLLFSMLPELHFWPFMVARVVNRLKGNRSF